MTQDNETEDPRATDAEAKPKKRAKKDVPAPAAHRRLELWKPTEYGDITRDGAMKLSKSRVAPIVALARGYQTVVPDGVTDFVKNRMFADARSTIRTQVNHIVSGSGDMMAMPWYSLSGVVNFSSVIARAQDESEADWRERIRSISSLSQSMFQFKPSLAGMDSKGKPIKYQFLKGQTPVIDVHPATPRDWFQGTSIFITEGVIKADSALTELLLNAGVSVEDLSEVTTMETARVKLLLMMERVPPKERVMIVAVGGVANWHNRSEWNDLVLRDRRVFIAFDGDVTTNVNVWSQASKMWAMLQDKHAEPILIDLNMLSVEAFANAGLADAGMKGMGVDDYFAGNYGDWVDLMAAGKTELPERPKAPEGSAVVGEYRISEDGQSLQVGVENKDENSIRDAYWQNVPGHGIGGRITRKVTRRKPTEPERADGKFRPADEDNAEIGVEIEVNFESRGGSRELVTIYGPATMLAELPGDWHKPKVGATVPSELLLSPEWPPPKYGREWLQAVKGNQADAIEDITIWNSMGWVPTKTGESNAFIAGDVVIAADETTRTAIRVGIGERELPGASSFGVIDSYRYIESADENKPRVPLPKKDIDEEERDIIRQVFDAMVFHGPWKDEAHAALVIAAGTRPCAAKRSINTIYALGEPGSGKTWTAAQIVSFWVSRPGSWTKDSLPGSAKDTIASIEKAVSATMVWAIDDWAPSPDPRKASDDESKMGDVVRATFNGTAKRRMNADMTSRQTLDPQALLIITAENELTVPSARERTIPITFQKGALDRKHANGNAVTLNTLNTMNEQDGTAAKMTAALLHDMIDRVSRNFDGEWKNLIEWEKERISEISAYAERVAMSLPEPINPNLAQRQVMMAADIVLGLMHLSQLALRLGMKDIYTKIIDPKFQSTSSEIKTDTLVYEVVKLVLSTYYRKDETRPGQTWIGALRNMLAAKTGHFSNGERPDHPPFEGSNQIALNDLVGWGVPHGSGPQEPKGAHLGWVYRDKEGVPFFLLHPENAFKEAKRQYPNMIQNGANKETYVSNVAVDQSLIVEDTKPGHKVTRRSSGTRRGLAIQWSAIVEGVPEDDVKVAINRKDEDD